MPETHFGVAISIATSLFNMREQFIDALRAAANAHIEESMGRDIYDHVAISRHALESLVDDALYAIGRDGLERLEDNVRHAVDEIVRDALDSEKGSFP
jgi:hypothetical protein